MDEPDSSNTIFWTKRWAAGKTPWDLGGIPRALSDFLQRETRPLRVFVPGCGTGYEIAAFHAAGHAVRAIEFSAPAVAHAREVLGPLGECIIHGNFFKHDLSGHAYDLVYERGFLCSMPTNRWDEWVERMARLVVPGGRLAGMFVYGNEPEPPPYPLTDETAAALLGRHFRLVRSDAAVGDSVEVYRGLERWQEWERVG